MASSNVQYYEKQKNLQETMTECEQQRMNLDKQLRVALQADQTNSKLRASKLQTYWRKICDDEKRAKQRNEMLMREFERIDAHMAEMNARTQRLGLMKKQYEDYITRTYPAWDKLMHGATNQYHQQDPTPQQQHTTTPPPQPSSPKQPQSPSPEQQAQPHKGASEDGHSEPEADLTSMASRLDELERQRQMTESTNQRQMTESTNQRQRTEATQQQQSIRAVEPHRGQQEPSGKREQPGKSHGRHEETIKKDTKIQSKGSDLQRGHQEPLSEIGEYANLPSARSLQGQPQAITPQPTPSVHQPSAHGTMEDEAEEETSEFATDTEPPMAQSLGNTVKPASDSPEKNKYTGPVKPELTIDGLFRLLSLVEQDMERSPSLEGYYRSSWPESARKNNIVKSANNNEDLSRENANLISMVILEQITLIVRSLTEKCLLPESLLQQDLNSLSALKLRQHLSPEAQVVWDTLYGHFQRLVLSQAMEPQELSAIFTPSLVANTHSQDRGHAFMVKLLERQFHTAATERQAGPGMGSMQTPRQGLEGSGSFADDGNVPPLKFGSLLERPLSDDESTYVKSSLPRDPVPLNETDAYRSMVTGVSSMGRRQSSTQDDTDDDVEKQVANALTQPSPPAPPPITHPSPRRQVEVDEPSETSSMQTLSHHYVPTAAEIKQITPRQQATSFTASSKFQGVKISSDLDTDTEVDVGIFGSSKKVVEDDFDFYD